MNQIQLWQVFARKNPSFEGRETVTLTTSGLRKLFDTTWEQAHKTGFENGKAYAEMHRPTVKDDSLFGRIFGPR